MSPAPRPPPHLPVPSSLQYVRYAAVLAHILPGCASPGSDADAAASDDAKAAVAAIDDAAAVGDAASGETTVGAPGDVTAGDAADADAPSPFVVPAEWAACSADADCYALGLSCCDACNGGTIGALHNKFVWAAKEQMGAIQCNAAGCGTQPCGKLLAVCVTGQCAALVDPGFAGGCADLSPSLCEASPSCEPIYAQPVSAAACWGGGLPAAPSVVGCRQAGVTCGSTPTCGHGPGAERAIFSGSCLPAGWTAAAMASCCDAALCPSGGTAAAVGRICLEPIAPATSLQPGAPFAVVVWPKGCFSSSCTKVVAAACDVSLPANGVLHIGAAFCLQETSGPGQACTDDCGGGGSATCQAPGLASAGAKKAEVGGWTIKFSVPSAPGQAICADAP